MPPEETTESRLPSIPLDTPSDTGSVAIDGATGSLSFPAVEEIIEEVVDDSIIKKDIPFTGDAVGLDPSTVLQNRLVGVQRLLSTSQEQNEKLAGRISDLEKLENKRNQETLNTEEQKELDEAFEFLDPEQREKVLKFMNRGKPSEESTLESTDVGQERIEKLENKIKAAEAIQEESFEVLRIYNGKDGRPTLEAMEPFVKYITDKFPDLSAKVPVKSLFAFAELAPYISYAEGQMKPEVFSNLTAEQMAKVGLYVLSKSKEQQVASQSTKESPKVEAQKLIPKTNIDLAALKEETASLSSEIGGSNSDGPISDQDVIDPRDPKYKNNSKLWIEDNLKRQGL